MFSKQVVKDHVNRWASKQVSWL